MARHEDGRVSGRVRDLAVPLAEALDIEVLDVEVGGPRSRPVIRVIADVADPTSEAGLDVEVVAKLSRRLGDALDEDDLVPGPFTLEVTSPGVDRPLTRVRDFQRNLGRDVRVTAAGQGDATTEITGRLVAVDEDHLTLAVDDADVHVAFADLDHGRVVLPW
jgi:ribosome maturation factor RimP